MAGKGLENDLTQAMARAEAVLEKLENPAELIQFANNCERSWLVDIAAKARHKAKMREKDFLLRLFVKDMREILDSYLGTDNEDTALDKLLELLRFLYTIDRTIFTEKIINEIQSTKREITIKKQSTPKIGTLPFKVGETYRDRVYSYVVEKLDGTNMWVKYENGLTEKIDLANSNKETIYRNIINEHNNVKTINQIIQTKIDEKSVNLWVKNFKRENHCYKCSAIVNINCEFCYVCGWFICKSCSACGCGYTPSQ